MAEKELPKGKIVTLRDFYNSKSIEKPTIEQEPLNWALKMERSRILALPHTHPKRVELISQMVAEGLL